MTEAAVAPAAPDGEWFVDRAAEAGLDFVHFNGMTGEFYQPEMAGPGAGLFDYDNDGDLDVYLVQGELLGDGDPLLAPPADHPPGDRLRARGRRRGVVGPAGGHPDGQEQVRRCASDGAHQRSRRAASRA